MITHPDKVLFPEDGITKGDLAAYYEAVAPVMLPHLGGRPLTMERYPSGIGRKGFWQKNVSKGSPAWLERVEVPKKGGVVHYPVVTDLQSLLWVVNQNTITGHVWVSRVPDLYHPDLCVLDLDPARDDPAAARAAAIGLRDLLAELLHESAERVSEFTQAIVNELTRRGRIWGLIHVTVRLVRNLAIDELIIGGDCWDRGPRGDKVVDYLRQQPNVSFVWGNHDVAWFELFFLGNRSRVSLVDEVRGRGCLGGCEFGGGQKRRVRDGAVGDRGAVLAAALEPVRLPADRRGARRPRRRLA